nr:hypothetical protein [Tanacetum cinerariifolium]
QQVALDEALVPSTQRLRIGRSNFRLPSDIQSKESTLQVVYDVLQSCPFFKAFLVTADVSKTYMQEFWATAYVHQHSIRFKLDNKMHIVNLETFRDMFHIYPRIPGQSFDELPFEEEILDFLRFLEHSAQIRTLTDVNIKKLFQPWRSFGAVINKCLTRKSSGFDSFWLSQAQILWGLYHSRNIDYAFMIWEDFVYQVKHKNQKKSNEMYDPRFTKPGGSGTDKGTSSKPGALDVPSDDSEEEISWNTLDDEDVDAQEKNRDDDEGDKKDSEDDGNGEEDQGLRISEEERIHKDEEADELYRDIDIN